MITRIYAVLLQELYLTKRKLEIIIDLFWFSGISIIVFGFIGKYLVGKNEPVIATNLIIGMLLWEVLRIGQYSLSVGPLWNIWSRNLSNMFRSPLSTQEYILALIISAMVKSFLVVALDSLLVFIFFKFNILSLGIVNVTFYFFSLSVFAWSLGIILMGVIFLYGTRIQALAWGSVFLLQPITATFFPVSVLPQWLQHIAYLLPSTYIFEAARATLSGTNYPTSLASLSLLQNIVYMILSLYLFNLMYKASKRSGQFAKNDNP